MVKKKKTQEGTQEQEHTQEWWQIAETCGE